MSLLKSAATVSSLTLLSRITGLVRDIVIARFFGATALTDAFWVAFRIPNLMRRLFAEGAFSQAFIPILGEIKQTSKDEQHIRQFIDRVALILLAALTTITLIGILAAPAIVWLMASGIATAKGSGAYESAVWMTRLMFPYIICMSLVAFASGVLNTYKRFAVPAFTPVLLNLSMIGGTYLLRNVFAEPIYALAVGVMIGGIAQLSVQWIALSRIRMRPRIGTPVKSAFKDPAVRRVIRQMAPATLGVSVAQVSLLINTNIATWLAPGSVSWLSFADRLMEFPTALIGVAIGTVLLPTLSKAHADKNATQYSAFLDWGLRVVLFLGLPAAVCMILMADAMVATLFQYGAFNANDVAQTQTAVMAYSVGLIGLLMIKILAPGFYGKQDIKTPVKIAIAVLLCTQAFNLILVPWLKHAGLALSIGLGACINAAALYIGLRKRHIYRPSSGWLLFLLRIAVALAALAVCLGWLGSQVNWVDGSLSIFARAGWLALTLCGGGVVYLAVLFILGLRMQDFMRKPT